MSQKNGLCTGIGSKSYFIVQSKQIPHFRDRFDPHHTTSCGTIRMKKKAPCAGYLAFRSIGNRGVRTHTLCVMHETGLSPPKKGRLPLEMKGAHLTEQYFIIVLLSNNIIYNGLHCRTTPDTSVHGILKGKKAFDE